MTLPSIDTMRARFATVVSDLLDTDDRAVVVLADIGASQFAAAAQRHRDRVVNVGIREQLMIGVAAGLALEGMRPIVHSYAPFLVERPFEQIKLDLGHQDAGAVLVSIGASYDAAGEGRTHQSPGDVALLATLPDWQIHVPGHPEEVEILLRDAVHGDGRVYLRLSSEQNRESMPVVPDRFVVVRAPRALPDAVVIAVGPTLDRVLEGTRGFDVTVLYAATVRPFDAETLRRVLGRPVVILVEPYLAGTSAAEASRALADVPHRLLSLGVDKVEHRRYGRGADHCIAHGLDAEGLRASILGFLRE